MANLASTWRARGNINPSRFVKIDTASDFGVLQCGAGERTIGIVPDGTKYPVVDAGFGSGASTVHAESGDPVRVYTSGEECLLEVNNAGTGAAPAISPGDFLISDANGRGIKWTTNNGSGGQTADTPSFIGAVALEAPSSGLSVAVIRVMVAYFSHTP